MKRRTFLAAAAATLAAPAVVRAEAARVLKFIPQADLAVLDPLWTTAYVTRNHGMMVFDQLYAVDETFSPQPQMAAGHVVEDDGKTWRITLRDGLMFHDGSKVLARDCVASIKRWGARDAFGGTLIAASDEISAPDDKTIVFRLKAPFPLLIDALGKPGSNVCVIMPERLAQTDPFKQVTEMVGSGPFRFKADERMQGSLVVYEKFAQYKPREDGKVSWTAGPKIVNFERVEWHVIPDPSTAAAALQTGEMEWWELPTTDLQPLLARNRDVRVFISDPTGEIACMRFNQVTPPFDNPAVRRALLLAINQEDTMLAVGGEDPAHHRIPAGFFTPATPMASDAGLSVFTGKRDYDAGKRALEAAGYKGERVAFMVPTDYPKLKAEADVSADAMVKIGFNVDYQATDWASVVARRAKRDPIDKGGWSVFCTYWAGTDQVNPAVHTFLRGNGDAGTMGWPRSPEIETLRTQWLDAPDLASQKAICEKIQLQALKDLPYMPLGQNIYPIATRANITGLTQGFPKFWNVQRT
ncbi:MAG TPA: ABC transporter substrate-binding protein [Acidisphaera sp.]|nr:ABC transporter substrate-binding protein [Acidisphaera sp.]